MDVASLLMDGHCAVLVPVSNGISEEHRLSIEDDGLYFLETKIRYAKNRKKVVRHCRKDNTWKSVVFADCIERITQTAGDGCANVLCLSLVFAVVCSSA